MEMPEKEKKKQQTNSVSSKPQKQIRDPELSEEELLQIVERLREFMAAHPDFVQLVRQRPAQEACFVMYLSLAVCIMAHLLVKYLAKSGVSPSVGLQKTQSAPLPSSDSVKSKPPESFFQRIQRKLKALWDAPMKVNSPPSESLWETDSTDSGVCIKSASSMSEPINFNPQRKQSCSVCEEAVKDPVLLPCGHWSCKLCVHSFWEQYGLTADDPCKKCGRRSEREKRDLDLQSVLLEKTIKRVEVETEKLQAEKETFQAEKQKFQAEKETFQAEKEKFQAEKETFQAEKEKFQAEKEKLELEKRKLTLEIQSLERKGIYTN